MTTTTTRRTDQPSRPPCLLAAGWLRGSEHSRKVWLEASVAVLVGLLINQVISMLWPHPRPFMIGLGHTLISHAADSSFPSDHLTLLWAFAFSLLMHRSQRMTAVALTLLGLPMAWARIYLGVHFPLDMLSAALVAGFSAWLACHGRRLYMLPLYRLAIAIHRALFGALIKRGWVSK